MPSPTPSRDPQAFLSQWGFSSEAPESLKAHAEQCSQYYEYPANDIVIGLKLFSADQVDAAMVTRPANVLALDHLMQAFPALREHSLRISALSRGLAFLPVIEDRMVEAGSTLAPTARARLDQLNAAFIRTFDDKPMVLFSDLSNLLTFSQLGRVDKLQDPVRAALTEEPLVALAPPMLVARAARNETSDESIRVISSAAQDNYWTPSMAKTDAERVLARLMDESLSRRATDIELSPQRDGTANVRIRIFGDMTTPERHAMLSPEHSREITNFLVSRSRAGDGGRLRRAADGQLTYKNSSTEVFVRASFIPADRFGLDHDMISTSLRLLPRTTQRISLKELNLGASVNDEVRKALIRTQGLIVVAGPTNSGKSTTIAGVVGEHLHMFGATKKRLSLEDPVERYLEGITQISVDDNFAELIRALLRHDPDLIWVGEIRDAFSAAACVRAAGSGHVVLSTVHANNSILAFRAISNYLRRDTGEATGGGASLFDLAESISLLIGQRLVKKLCPHCRRARKLTKQDMTLAQGYLKAEAQGHLWPKFEEVLSKGVFEAKPEGCKACSRTGYVGELPVNELLPVNREVRELFSSSETRIDVMQLSHHRLNTLAESALHLISTGDTEFQSLFI